LQTSYLYELANGPGDPGLRGMIFATRQIVVMALQLHELEI